MPAKILVIDDETVFAENVATYLARAGHQVSMVATAESGLKSFEKTRPDLVLLDYRLGETDGLDVLAEIRAAAPGTPVIMLTGYGDIDVAVKAMKAGALDFLTKPVSLERIGETVKRVLGGSAETKPKEDDDAELQEHPLIGESGPMKALKQRIDRIVSARDAIMGATPPSVLILGETGTGKELVARALHALGPRRSGPFVSMNCAAIPSHLLEAELFGYERGAFTDAKAAKPGLLEAANGGVLFLDEIGDLDLSVQAKLLRALDQRTIRRIGSLTDRPVDIWVVSATNRDLAQLAEEQAFRPDLLYRLNIVTIETPPLRERGEDMVVLARNFVRSCRSDATLTASALERLKQYRWPGNVRQLRNAIERAALMTAGNTIDADDLELDDDTPRTTAVTASVPTESLHLADVERELMVDALERTQGKISPAASLLGISRDTLRYRMKKHGLLRKLQLL